MFAGQAQTFYDDLSAAAKQLTKMETYLASNKQVGLLPETLRSQQRQFMVSCVSVCVCYVCDVACSCHCAVRMPGTVVGPGLSPTGSVCPFY